MAVRMRRVCTLVYFLRFLDIIMTFNLDIHAYVSKQGPDKSLFGFSLAPHIYNNDRLLLVGAPQGDASYLPGVQRPGVIYRCPANTANANDCTQLQIGEDKVSATPTKTPPKDVYNKTDQWLGVSLSSEGKDQRRIITCAHRLSKWSTSDQYVYPVGKCYVRNEDFSPGEKDFEVCTDFGKYQHSEAYCTSGVASGFSKTGMLLIGAPGAVNWRGVLVKTDYGFGKDYKLYHSPMEEKNAPVPQDSYLGFSVTSGRYFGNATEVYVSGAPRALSLGQVVFFWQGSTDKLEWRPEYRLTGDKFGSMFGYSVASLDCNGDGLVDLVVGAPFYLKDKLDSKEKRAAGAVYVYVNSKEKFINESQKLLGREMSKDECVRLKCEDARFGFALAGVGDINQDGYEDLAVGAPYEGGGVVYIYNGYQGGLKAEYSQRITGDKFSARSFGSSLSGGLDMDGNSYPDILVGAFESNKAFVVRSRPVIEIHFREKFVSKKIDPKVPCVVNPSLGQACVRFMFCFNYSEPTHQIKTPIDLKYTLTSDIGRAQSRMEFPLFGGPKITRGVTIEPVEACYEEVAYLKNETREDIFMNVKFKLTFEPQITDPPRNVPGQPLTDLSKHPVISRMDKHGQAWPAGTRNYLRTNSIPFVKDCGPDERCLSDLTANVVIRNLKQKGGKYELPSGTGELQVEVDFQNYGEAAYDAKLIVISPASLQFINTEPQKKKREVNSTYLEISLGNPFGAEFGPGAPRSVTFALRFDPSHVKPEDKELHIQTIVKTESEDTNPDNDVANLYLNVIVVTDAALVGSASPDQAYFSGTTYGESAVKYFDQIGMQVNHSYEVQNKGIGTIYQSQVIIDWPYEAANNEPQGKHLFYPTQLPTSDKPKKIHCRASDMSKVNPLGAKPRPYVNLTANSRRKRDTVVYSELRDDPNNPGKKAKIVRMDCRRGTAKCIRFTCDVKKLLRGETVFITVVARLWNSTFLEDYRDVDYIEVFSHANLTIDSSKIIVRQTDLTNDVSTARTLVQPLLPPVVEKEIAIWIYIVAALGGVLLLVLLIILLWKLGFFRRKRPEGLEGMHEVKVRKQKDDYLAVDTEDHKWMDASKQ